MGQAKRRGSFEERKASSLEKAAHRAIDDAEAVRNAAPTVPVNRRVRGFMPSALAMAAMALAQAPGEQKNAPK
jgi:hypothetical protein